MSTAPILSSEHPLPAALQPWWRLPAQPAELPTWSQELQGACASLALGESQAALHLFQGSGFRGFFFFLTTLQSRSPAPLPAAFELLWNKADTIL